MKEFMEAFQARADVDVDGEQLDKGPKVTFFLKENQLEYLDKSRIKDLVKKHFEFISFPIYLWTKRTIEKEISDEEDDELCRYPMRRARSFVMAMGSCSWVTLREGMGLLRWRIYGDLGLFGLKSLEERWLVLCVEGLLTRERRGFGWIFGGGFMETWGVVRAWGCCVGGRGGLCGIGYCLSNKGKLFGLLQGGCSGSKDAAGCVGLQPREQGLRHGEATVWVAWQVDDEREDEDGVVVARGRELSVMAWYAAINGRLGNGGGDW
ncbi:unnamed protein product [Dovyalis caffra]|uniref:Uncharacterized protein n=1 Tax=Dovyalis caffra TaxID=77055 RepID=A0AAV1RKU3_9ROSI|nr:unnamed protein product [Dovyalis caffra]